MAAASVGRAKCQVKISHEYLIEMSLLSPLFADGVVLVDPEYVATQKVYAHVLAAFRYGREDLDVLGLTFRKDLYLASAQVRQLFIHTNGENKYLNIYKYSKPSLKKFALFRNRIIMHI